MPLDMFLDLGPIKGESQDKVHAGKIDILAWSWGVTSSGPPRSGGGGGASKATFQDIAITKVVDLSSTELLKAAALGTHLPEAKVIVRRAGANARSEYYSITMKDVMVTGCQIAGSEGGDQLTESVTLAFASFEVTYHAVNAKGRPAGESTFDHTL